MLKKTKRETTIQAARRIFESNHLKKENRALYDAAAVTLIIYETAKLLAAGIGSFAFIMLPYLISGEARMLWLSPILCIFAYTVYKLAYLITIIRNAREIKSEEQT